MRLDKIIARNRIGDLRSHDLEGALRNCSILRRAIPDLKPSLLKGLLARESTMTRYLVWRRAAARAGENEAALHPGDRAKPGRYPARWCGGGPGEIIVMLIAARRPAIICRCWLPSPGR